MVEYKSAQKLDAVFGSLADPTRRDILQRLRGKEMSVGQLASHYELTFAAVSKHLGVLERAHLIKKRRKGRMHYVALSPPALRDAAHYLERYKAQWEERLDRLAELLNNK